MINKGNARSQCWVCHACHSSMKALIRSYSATPESKKLLDDDMRTNNNNKWYDLVRQCRIRASADEIGVSDIHSRKKAALEATQSMAQAFGVRDSSEVLWLTHDRFIAHQVYVEGIAGATLQEKEQAAEAKWNRDIANADIVRRGTGVDTQLGVMGVPRTEGYRGRESNRIVTCSDTVRSNHQMDSIMQHLSQHGATAQALTGKAMGELGAVVMQRSASSSSDTMVQYLPPRNISAPPASVICEPSALEPRVPPDPMKRLRWGITGELLVMRNDALARIKVACDSYGTVKTNVAKRWDALCKAGHAPETSMPPEMSAWARQVKDTLSKLKYEIKKDDFT
jgi:hypothetical protein